MTTVMEDVLAHATTDDIRGALRIHLRLAAVDAVVHYLRDALLGDELLLKEVWEACETADDRGAVLDEVRGMIDRIVPGPLPANLYIFSMIAACQAELAKRSTSEQTVEC